MNIRLLLLLSNFFSVAALFGQAQDSLLQLLQRQVRELKVQRSQDSLKVNMLSQELQALLLLDTKYADTSKDSLYEKQRQEEIKRIYSKANGAPVCLEKDTLYTLYTSLGLYSPLERSEYTEKKLQKLAELATFKHDSLKIQSHDNLLMITYQGEWIQAVTEEDAIMAHLSQEELAKSLQRNILKGVTHYRKEHSMQQKLMRIGELVLLVMVIVTFFYLLNFLFRKLRNQLLKQSFLGNGIKVKNYQILDKEKINYILTRILYLVKFLIFFIVIFLSIPVALKLFPSTQLWAERLLKLLLEPLSQVGNAIVDYLPNLVIIGIIALIARLVLNLMRFFLYEIERGALKIKGFYKEWAKPTYKMVRILFLCFIFIVIFPYLPGSGSSAFQGVSIFLGLLISLGSSSTISNGMAGIFITYMRAFRENDWIKVGDYIGMVIHKDSLVTRLKTINNEEVTVPNSMILSSSTMNFSSMGRTNGLVVTTQVKVRYDARLEDVDATLIAAAQATKGVTDKITPYIYHISLNELNATYEINAVTFEPQNMYIIKSDLIKNIYNAFRERNIELTSIEYVELRKYEKV
ncbi:mechanosensitive ion channel domain-containing protein [Capnocytophaga gingivalis]|jgi:mscS mechanosensitive ion channel|uniref:mechanosensitive ion channel family protein n=1 Tax=Capnocytophaga gingivalis TaxID=1017 RepID=UPI0028CFFD74|nr:mechanosensitive ion channel domain-containing protein [Capnocytophaga gingivalis]